MTRPIHAFPLLRRPPAPPANGEHQELQDTLNDLRLRINQAYAAFNQARDNELIDSYVFEINALQTRYNYLLRRMKELEAAV